MTCEEAASVQKIQPRYFGSSRPGIPRVIALIVMRYQLYEGAITMAAAKKTAKPAAKTTKAAKSPKKAAAKKATKK